MIDKTGIEFVRKIVEAALSLVMQRKGQNTDHVKVLNICIEEKYAGFGGPNIRDFEFTGEVVNEEKDHYPVSFFGTMHLDRKSEASWENGEARGRLGCGWNWFIEAIPLSSNKIGVEVWSGTPGHKKGTVEIETVDTEKTEENNDE